MNENNGFAMVDALVALFILTLAMSSLLGVNQRSLAIASTSKSKMDAIYIAKALIEDPSLRGTTGTVTINGKVFRWNRNTTYRQFNARDKARLSDTQISVHWTQNGTEKKLAIGSIKLGSIHE